MKLALARIITALAVSTSSLAWADQPGAGAPQWDWQSRGAGGGGAFFAPSFNPRNPQEMWVTSDMGPVIHTTNLDKPDRAWQTIHFTAFRGGRSSHVSFTSDPKILYGLDGDKKGPIKSTDGGATWNSMEGFKGEGAVLVFADTSSATRVLVATKDDLFLSTNGGDSFTSIFHSPGVYTAGVFFDSADKALYVGTNRGLLKSENDGALTVQEPALPNKLEMSSFTGAKDATSGAIRLMCVAGTAGRAKPGAEVEAIFPAYKGIYSLDAGQNAWVDRSNGIPAGNLVAFIAMANGNIKTIYAAGTTKPDETPAVYKIANADTDWKWVSVIQDRSSGFKENQNVYTGWEGDGGDRGYGFDGAALDFQLDPGNIDYAAVTGDGFVHYTSDGGATWHQAYVDPADENAPAKLTPRSKAYRNVGLNDTAVHYLAWADENTIFAGYTDIEASRSTDGGKTWAIPDRTNLENTQYKVELAPSGALYAANSSSHDIYQTWSRRGNPNSGNLIISTDKGATWKRIHRFPGAAVWEQLDPKDPNTMYVSVMNVPNGGIYKTIDLQDAEKATWTKLAAPPRTENHPYDIRILDDGSLVVSYSCHWTNKFTPSSGVFISSDGGKTWEDRSDPNMQYYTKEVVIDPTDPKQNTWYAAVHKSFGDGDSITKVAGLYKTADRGKTWKCVLEVGADGAESCTINPANKEIFVVTEGEGMYWAPDTSADDLKFVLTNYPYMHPYRVFINPFDAKDIWVASYGNGIAEAKEKMNHATITVPGLKRNLKLLHVTDTHLFRADPGSPHEARCRQRIEYFNRVEGATSEEYAKKALSQARRQQWDAVLLSGDIIDFPSSASLELATVLLSDHPQPRAYISGNHDWLFPGQQPGAAMRERNLPLLAPLFSAPAASLYHRMEIDGLQILSIDNSNYQINADQLEFFRTHLQSNMPTLLMMHIPFSLPRLRERTVAKWEHPILMGETIDEKICREWGIDPMAAETFEFIELARHAKNLRGIFCGHVHLEHEERWSESAIQYVTAPGFEAKWRKIEIRGRR